MDKNTIKILSNIYDASEFIQHEIGKLATILSPMKKEVQKKAVKKEVKKTVKKAVKKSTKKTTKTNK